VPLHLRRAQIPPLLLQPLVEHAIKHGIAPSRAGGEVIITAHVETTSLSDAEAPQILQIEVRDTGAGASDIEMAQGRRRGLGIKNVEQRLKSYYGSAASFSIESVRGTGTAVEIRLPVVIKQRDEETESVVERRRA
jgi:sensor histidine kinase YesM